MFLQRAEKGIYGKEASYLRNNVVRRSVAGTPVKTHGYVYLPAAIIGINNSAAVQTPTPVDKGALLNNH